MAKLKKCKDCGTEVSKKADKCPNCGAPTKRKPLGCGALIVLIIGAVMITNIYKETYAPPVAAEKPLPTTEAGKKQLEATLLAELKTIPAKEYQDNLERYKKLLEMFPQNSTYKSKVAHYEAKAARQEKIEQQFSPWNGSHENLSSHIRKNLKNPDSYEHVQTLYVDKGDHLILETTYRATNSFNAIVTEKVLAKVNLDGSNLTILQ